MKNTTDCIVRNPVKALVCSLAVLLASGCCFAALPSDAEQTPPAGMTFRPAAMLCGGLAAACVTASLCDTAAQWGDEPPL